MNGFTIEVRGSGLPWMNLQRPVIEDGRLSPLGGSFGARIIPTENPYVFALRLENGVDAPTKGAFYFNSIVVRCPSHVVIVPRKNHTADGNTFTIGAGNEYFPARAIKTTRFALVPWYKRLASVFGFEPWRAIFALRPKVRKHDHLALPRSLSFLKAKRDADGERILTALRTGNPDPGVDIWNSCGCWMPCDEMDPGYVSGKNIEPHPGADQSPLWRILAHDLLMERMFCSHVTPSGQAIYERRQEFWSTRGWNVSTQISDFAAPMTLQSGDDRRVPRELNTGTCAYREKFAPALDGSRFYEQRYLGIDDAHYCRATRHAKVCAILFGDPVAKLDLEMLAADVNKGVHIFNKPQNVFGQTVGKYPDALGCDRYGRGLGWALNALQACGARWTIGPRLEIVAELKRVQHKDTGSYQVFPKTYPHEFPNDPWNYWHLSREYDVAHTLEVAYLALGVAHEGEIASAEKAAAFMSTRPPQQWIANKWPPDIQVGEGESFSCWALWGFLATRRPTWKDVMARMTPPGANKLAGPNVHAALMATGYFEACAKALEATEP